MSRRTAGFLTRIAAAIAMTAGVASADTLGDALASAYTHSGLLEQNRALLRAADEDVAVALSALRPVINWSGDVSRSFGTTRSSSTGGTIVAFGTNEVTLGIAAELTLFDYGRGKLGVEAAKEAVLATREGLISIEQQVLFRAVSAFMDLRSASETLALRQNNVRLITQELRAARDRFEVGEVTRTDVAQAEARLALARSNLAVAQGNLDVARAEYAAAIGHKPGSVAFPRSLPKLPTREKAIEIAMRQHPDMRRAQFEASVADINIKRAEAAMKPSVTLSGRLAAVENVDNNYFTRSGEITLGASGPIYQGGRLSALLRQAIARRDSARGNLHVVRQTIRQNVENAYARLEVANAARQASAQQVRAAEIAFRGAREEASLGARTTLDVLNAEQELLNARTNQITAVVDEYVAAYQALAAMGLLTVEHLNLPVQRYDPAEYYNLVKSAPALKSKQGQQLDRVLRSIGND